MTDTNKVQICLNCGATEQQVPLVSIRFNQAGDWICTQCLPTLIHGSINQFGRAGDASAVFAPEGQVHAKFAQGIQQRTPCIDLVGYITAVCEGYGMGTDHSQMSLVQSPPG